MQQLNRRTIKDLSIPADVAVGNLAKLPEKVLQFGEGNFLRAFVDWHFQALNTAGYFNGNIVVVQPIAQGMGGMINDQDGLYTCLLRGIKDGRPIEKREIITNISRVLKADTQWAELVAVAESNELEYVVSNTTEAGIVFDAEDTIMMTPPHSYPAKLALLLYARYLKFRGAADKGLVIIPCELIEQNGQTLRQVILRLIDAWQLPVAFAAWVREHNTFVSTLVDRVVTGYPKDEIENIWQALGYRDNLVVAGELYHLWVLEAPAALAERLPFARIGLNVIWTDDQRKYRERKVRILNGAHTTGVPVAYQYGLDTVRQMMEDSITGKFVTQAIYEEIIPSMDDEPAALQELASEVINRFKNPYIKHYLLSIMLNSSSKYKARVLPSLLAYQQKYSKLPLRLVFALAGLLNIYALGELRDNVLCCQRSGEAFRMQDDLATLHKFTAIWQTYAADLDLHKAVQSLLGADEVWGLDLNTVPELAATLCAMLTAIRQDGMRTALTNMTGCGQ